MASIVVVGSATNPSAAALITGATTGTLAQGEYTVTVTTQLSGTTAAADLNNMQLQAGTTVIGPLLTPPVTAVTAVTLAATTIAASNPNPFPVQVTISGGTVTAIAVNGTTTNATSGTFTLGVGGFIAVTYSVAPTTFTTAALASQAGSLVNVPVVVAVPEAGAAITVNAIGNASGASVVYKAQIVATVP